MNPPPEPELRFRLDPPRGGPGRSPRGIMVGSPRGIPQGDPPWGSRGSPGGGAPLRDSPGGSPGKSSILPFFSRACRLHLPRYDPVTSHWPEQSPDSPGGPLGCALGASCGVPRGFPGRSPQGASQGVPQCFPGGVYQGVRGTPPAFTCGRPSLIGRF